MKSHPLRSILVVVIVAALASCGPLDASTSSPGAGGKGDTGWVSGSTFEVDAYLTSTVTHRAEGELAELATDRALQEQLADAQIKYAKATMEAEGYLLDQIAQEVEILEVTEQGGAVTIRYRALVDLIKERPAEGWSGFGEVPALEDLEQKRFEVPLPLDPIGVMSRAGERCADDWEPYVLAEYKYYYYFKPDKEGCDLPMHSATLELERVNDQTKLAYPEYDQLLNLLPSGARGFKAAVLPGEAHDTLKNHLESDLLLDGTQEQGFVRYRLEGKGVAIVIDLYPSAYKFRSALGDYQLLYYHGHSNYGTNNYLTNASDFSDKYQIVAMNSCRTYSYYARQLFAAKATPADPTGWAASDFVATVHSNWISYSAATVVPLLESLLEGIEAVHDDEPHRAPDWLSIVKKMDAMDSDTLYGAAGVRTNSWRPAQ